MKLSTVLSKMNKEIRDTLIQFKSVNKLSKLHPGNAELMAQPANDALARGEISQSKYDAL